MTQTPTVTPPTNTDYAPRPAPKHGSAWSGWIIFAGVMLGLVGSFQLIEGFVALFEHGYYLVARHGLVIHMSYTAWGWVHLAIGAANIFAGFGLFAGRTAARIWAILVTSVSAIANIGFTSAYPVWSVVIITLDVIVIYALCVHWDEVDRI